MHQTSNQQTQVLIQLTPFSHSTDAILNASSAKNITNPHLLLHAYAHITHITSTHGHTIATQTISLSRKITCHQHLCAYVSACLCTYTFTSKSAHKNTPTVHKRVILFLVLCVCVLETIERKPDNSGIIFAAVFASLVFICAVLVVVGKCLIKTREPRILQDPSAQEPHIHIQDPFTLMATLAGTPTATVVGTPIGVESGHILVAAETASTQSLPVATPGP